VAGFGGGFAAVFWVLVGIAVAGAAGDDAAGAAQTGGVGVGGAALDAADTAVLGIVGEYGFAVVGGIAVAVRGAGRAILEAPGGCGIGRFGGFEVWGNARAVRGNRHRDAGRTAARSQKKMGCVQHCPRSDAVVHPPLTREP